MSTRDTNSTDRTVQSFYEKHPYPPPVTDLDDVRRLWEDEGRRRADHHLHWPNRPFSEDQSILVAGCGTSQAARHALRQPKAQVVGIDVSTTSIRHTESLKDRHALANLEVREHPIERVGDLGRRFDRIVCTGVLHHLADPEEGLRALRQVLAPDGAMHLMVYAAYGRIGVSMIQEYGRRLGLGTSDREITDLANTMMILPQGHPLAHLLGDASDFRTKAGLADALLHPRERSYTVPQFFALLKQVGLRFGRWIRQAPYLPQCGDPATTQHIGRLLKLPAKEQYACMELLRGTMVRHSAIIYRDDGPVAEPGIPLDAETWRDLVPIPLPETVRVEERLPRGAAAVLINRAHIYSDLYMPIDAAEKRMLDAIDGRRTIAAIAEDTLSARHRLETDKLRDLFKRLWWHDQVVFDASGKSR